MSNRGIGRARMFVGTFVLTAAVIGALTGADAAKVTGRGAGIDDGMLERNAEGRGTVVEYEVDARFKRVRYRLRQLYDEPRRLASEYLGGDFRDFCGEWRFEPTGDDRTRVELDLRIDPGRFVPSLLRTAIADAVMRRALRDLQAYVER